MLQVNNIRYMTEELPIFLMLIGIAGSGKSFWVRNNISEDDFVVISSDNLRRELTGNVSDLSEDKVMWPLAKKRVAEALSNGKNVILDATNVNGYHRRNFIKDLPPCRLQAKLFPFDPEKAKKRIKKDIENEVDRSHVPMHVIDEMFRQFDSYCTPKLLKKEGFEIIKDI